MKKVAGLAVAALALWFILRQFGVVPGGNPMEGARYAATVPVFPGADFEDVGGGNYYDEIGGPVTFTSKSWTFKMTAPVSEVAAYYRANLPSGATAWPEEDVGEGEAGFTWVPPGAREGEEVQIYIEPGEFRISETLKAGT
jgi:hypothetical protein